MGQNDGCMPASTLFDDSSAHATISQIRPLANDPNLRRIVVGRKVVATLRSTDIESLKIQVGAIWTADLAAAAQTEMKANKARRAAMSMLGRRAYSRAEVVDRLVRKSHDRTIAERIARELAADHWIDDTAYAEAVVREASRKKPAGRTLLVEKLQARKIDPQITETVARAAQAQVDPLEAAVEFGRRKLASLHALPDAKARQRIFTALARRGFDEDTIAAVCDRLHLRSDEHND